MAVLRLREFWEYRELLAFFVWRDILLRYKQTAFGVGWVVLQPLATTAIFTVIFGAVAHMPSESIPYEMFVLAAFVPWTFFSSGLLRTATSLVVNANLITKIYFPRIIIPTASVLAGIIDMAVIFGVVLIGMLYYHLEFRISILGVPIFIALCVLVTLGVGYWMSALNARYRDVGAVGPFIVQLWLYLTPIVYPVGLVPERWKYVLALNPMTGVVQGIRWSLFGAPLSVSILLLSTASALAICVSGLIVFQWAERSFADVI